MVLVKFEAPPDFDPTVADKRNFYFAVKDWYVRGSCYCNGQSAECDKAVIKYSPTQLQYFMLLIF